MEKTIFKMNMVCFDSNTKDIVQISNGKEENGEFIPTEALAYRVVGVANRRPVVAFTYIKVIPETLSPARCAMIDWTSLIKTNYAGRV